MAKRIIPKDLCKQQRRNREEKQFLASPSFHQILCGHTTAAGLNDPLQQINHQK